MAITNITKNNTIDEWRIQTNQSANALNTLETGNYTKSNGTFAFTGNSKQVITATGVALQVANGVLFSTDLEVGKSITLGSQSSQTGNLTVGANTYIYGKGTALYVANNAIINSNLQVTNNITTSNISTNNDIAIGKNASIVNKLSMTGTGNVVFVNVGSASINTAYLTDMVTTNSKSTRSTIYDTLDVVGVTTHSSNIYGTSLNLSAVANTLTLNVRTDGTVFGNLNTGNTVTANTTQTGNLRVTTAANVDGTLRVTGGSNLTSTLRVTGASNLESTLKVTGGANLDSTLRVTGTANLDSTLNVVANTTSGNLNTTGLTHTGTLRSTGRADFATTVDTVGNTTSGNLVTTGLTHTGTLRSTGQADFGSNINITANTTAGNLVTTGLTHTGTLRSTGRADFATTVDVVGNTTSGNLVTTGLTQSGTLRTTGQADFGSNVNVTANTTTGNVVTTGLVHVGTIRTTGIANLGSTLRTTGAANLDSTLRVTGAANLDSTLKVIGGANLDSTLRVTDASNLDSTLKVTGAANLDSTLRVTSFANLDSTLTVAQQANFLANVAVTTNTTSGNFNTTGLVHTNSLRATGRADIVGSLTAQNADVASNMYVGNTLTVDGQFQLAGAVVFDTDTFVISANTPITTVGAGYFGVWRGNTSNITLGSNGSATAPDANAYIRFEGTSNTWQIRDIFNPVPTTMFSKILTANLISDSITSTISSNIASSLAVKTAYDTATFAGGYANAAYRHANSSYLHANSAYLSQNSTGNYANNAYIHANNSYMHANAAHIQANSVYIHANAAYTSQNTTGVYANTAHLHANSAYVSQNSTGQYANSAYLHANAAYLSQNSTGNYANSAYAFANTRYSSSGGTVSGDVVVTGNLTVSGLTTYVNTTELRVGDAIITLNADLPQASAPTENAGIEVERGTLDNAAVIWNETTDKWTFTNDGTIYSNMGSAAAESYSNSAYLQANSSYNQANTATTNAATADQRAVTSGSYANSAYLQANTATTNAATADQRAVTSGSYANSAYAKANTAASLYLTSVTGTAPVVSSGGLTPAISMAAATSAVNGYMTSTYASKLDGIDSSAINSVTIATTAPITGGTTGRSFTLAMPAATASVNGYMTSTYASKLDGIAAGATNVTNNNQISNGNGFISSVAITTTAPLTGGGTASSFTLAMAAATSAVNGYMTSTYASKLDGIAAGATNVTNTNQLTNGAGYITGITSGNVTTALGYTPFNNASISSYAPLAGCTFSGQITVSKTGAAFTTAESGQIEVNNNASGAAFINFHRVGAYGAHFGLDTDNVFSTAGWSAGSGAYTAMRVGAFAAYGAITSTADITAYYSDERLKKNITPISDALSKVHQIKGVTYQGNDIAASYGYDDKIKVGVIAQDLEKVLPQVVVPAPFDTDKEGNSISGENYKTVQYEKIVPLLIEAIKELSDKVKELEAQINK